MSHGDCHQNSDESKTETIQLTREFILCHAGEFEIESIQHLKLCNYGFSELSPLEECTNLLRMNLSGNNISNIRPLCYIKALTALNLSNNKISNIDPLSQLEFLKELNLAGNLICSFERLKPLKNLEHLEIFRLHDLVNALTNPLCNTDKYITTILAMFPKLVIIDGDRVNGRGKELFQICQELDDQLKSSMPSHELDCPCDSCQISGDKRTFGPVEQRPLPGKWLSSDFFNTNQPVKDINTSIEQARKAMLDVRDLDSKAQAMIDAIKNESNID